MYSKDSYRQLLDIALQQGYRFSGFSDKADSTVLTIYLRHDVDYSLDMACELARINTLAGVQGTFFLLFRSQVYNLLSHWALERVQEIRALNQRLAFHFALPFTVPSEDDSLVNLILSDFEIVRQQIPEIEPVFSWHNPTPSIIDRGLAMTVPGLINVYSQDFIKTLPYFSDSNMRFSVAEFQEIIEKEGHRTLHLLLHPFNWIAGGTCMQEIFAKTWQYVIREREREIGLNVKYRSCMPQGMPEDVLNAFSKEWLRSIH